MIVDAVVHQVVDGEPYGIRGPLLLIDGPTAAGFSGGPVLDERGRLVGLLQGFEPNLRLTLAVPAPEVARWLDEIAAGSAGGAAGRDSDLGC